MTETDPTAAYAYAHELGQQPEHMQQGWTNDANQYGADVADELFAAENPGLCMDDLPSFLPEDVGIESLFTAAEIEQRAAEEAGEDDDGR